MGVNGRATAALVLSLAVRSSSSRHPLLRSRSAASRSNPRDLRRWGRGAPRRGRPHGGPPGQMKKEPRPHPKKPEMVRGPRGRSSSSSSSLSATAVPLEEVATVGPMLRSTFLTSVPGWDPLPWKLPTFGDAVMGTYDNCTDLEADLYESVRYLANEAILSNADIDPNNRWYYGPMPMPVMMFADAPAVAGGASASTTSDLNSFDTNNQEVGVSEKDIIVSDGDIVCAGYGAEVISWDAATGVELSRTKIPDANGAQWWMRSRVDGLFLWGNKADGDKRLIVLGAGYEKKPPASVGNNTSILDNYGNVLVMIWDMMDPKKPKQLAETYVNGYMMDARIVGDTAHIVTSSHVNDWAHLTNHYDRYNKEFDGMNRTEYIDAALNISAEIIPAFVTQLMDELKSDGECGDVSKIFFFQTGGTSLFGTGGAMMASIMCRGWGCGWSPRPDSHIKNLMRVTTFDVAGSSSSLTSSGITTRTAKAFQPTSGYFIYASKEKLVIPAQGYALQDDNTTIRSTMLRMFELQDDAAAETIGIAVVNGTIRNQFSMDEHDNHLRVASSIPREWGCRNETAMAVNPDLATWDPNCDNGITRNSTNQMAIFKLPDSTSNLIQQVSIAENLGIDEIIYSARFFDDMAYLVTFRQTDPFYALNLTDNMINLPLGELKITGFSNYLHGVTQEADVIVAIGMEANELGVTTGFAMSLFDASDLTDPKLIARHFEPTGSRSDAQYDHKAFRAVPNPDLTANPKDTWAMYVIPVSIYDWRNPSSNWDGFKLYNVTYNGLGANKTGTIEYMFNVTHERVYGCNYIPSRSFVIDGKLTTIKSHKVLNTDIATENLMWEFNLTGADC